MAQPLPRLTWTKTQNVFSVTSTTAAILAALVTELTNAGCTVEQHTQGGVLSCIGVTLPGADVSDLRILIAGRSTSETVSGMLTPDTYAADRLLMGVSKGITSETIVDWRNANPYGGGTFSGFWRMSGATTSINALFVVASAEAIMVSVQANAGSAPWLSAFGGAFIDPHSENAASCETSGRVYGMQTQIALTDANIWGTQLSGLFDHNTGANTATHFGAFLPRSSTWTTLRRAPMNTPRPAPTSTSLQTPGAVESVCVPIYCESLTTPFPVYGRIREVFFWHDDIHGRTVNKAGPTVAGYTIAAQIAASSDAAFMAAADNRA